MPHQPVTIQKFVGLHIQANSFSQVPDGALERAENIVITNDGIIRKRRGFSLLTTAASMITPRALTEYGGALLVAHNGILAQVDRNTGTLTSLSGAFLPASSRPRFAQAGGNLYGTTIAGVRKVENLGAPLLPAGVPPGLDLAVTLPVYDPGAPLVVTWKTGVFRPNSQVGYRVVFGRKDVSGNKVVGAPSELTTSTNSWYASSASYTSASFAVTVTVTAHNLTIGDTVVLGNGTSGNVDGEWSVASTTVNTFTVNVLAAPLPTSGTLNVGLYKTPRIESTLPTGLSTEHFIQVYRTTQTESVEIDVSDDGQLVLEANLTAGQVSSGIFTFDDDIAELFKGASLYTNPNQSGLQSANFPPPLCDDIAVFKACTFFASIESAHELPFALTSVQAADIAAGNYIEIISGVTTKRYVATTNAPTPPGGAPNTSSNWNYGGLDASGHVFFQLFPSTPTSIASSIARTAKSLCKAINRHATGLVYAYYVSGPNDVPGSIRFVRRVSASTFTVKAQNATVGDAFSPNLWNGGNGRASTNTDLPHALAFSKPQEPESVPLPFQLLVGAKSAPIQRIIPLRDSLLVLKADGLWRVSGEGPSSFSVTLVDSTISCVAPDSVVALNNQVYFLSTQGVVAATETSAQVLSRPIEAILAPILGSPVLAAQTAGVAYESDRTYALSTIQPGSATADVVYVYNTVTQAWTTWDRTFKDALVFPGDDRLFLLDSSSRIVKERKSQNQLDFCDFSNAATCTLADIPTRTARFTGATLTVGDAIVKVGSEIINRIIALDASTIPPTATFSSPLAFKAGDSVIVYSPIFSTVKTTPLTLGDATVWKMFTDMRLSFRNRATTKLRISFDTDSRSSGTTDWEAETEGFGWGFNWGSEWGGTSIATVYPTQAAQECRTYVPLETSRGTYLQTTIAHERAAESFEVQSLSITARAFGPRISR